MQNNPTPDEVRASIVPKSDQLNADDLVTGPITVTITKVGRGDHDQPLVVELEGQRPYKPCKTMRRVLIATFSDEPAQWVGQRMTLFCDPTVMWGGVKVGGIRISHLTGIDNPRTFLVATGRGKRTEVTIRPIVGPTDDEKKFIEAAAGDLATAATIDILKGHGALLASKSKPVQDQLRPVYAKRLNELKENEETQDAYSNDQSGI